MQARSTRELTIPQPCPAREQPSRNKEGDWWINTRALTPLSSDESEECALCCLPEVRGGTAPQLFRAVTGFAIAVNWPPSFLCLASQPLPVSPWVTSQINYLPPNSYLSGRSGEAQPQAAVCSILLYSVIVCKYWASLPTSLSRVHPSVSKATDTVPGMVIDFQ